MIKIEGVDPKMIANNLTPSELIHPFGGLAETSFLLY